MQASRGDPGLRAATALLAWLGGTALQLQQRALCPAWINAALVLAGLLLACVALRGAARWRLLLVCFALASVAFGITSLRAGLRLAEQLAVPLEGRDLLLTGVVDQMPQVSPEGVRFVLAVDSAFDTQSSVYVPALVSLVWLHGLADDGGPNGLRPDLRAGQRWQVPVRLRRPHGAMNPHGFDGELWLFEQRIG
ncbi:MAG TPA: ComEC/Rec2 family competence protein, partial [Burkholderiaceae bacterium]